MSAGKLTDFVDEKGFEQLDLTTQKLGIIRQELRDTIVVAKELSDAIGNTRSLSEFAVASNNATAALQKVQAANEAVFATQKEISSQTDALVNKTAQNLLAAEQKKQDAAEKTLNKYLVNQSKQNAAAEAQMNKEVNDANQKAQKLIQIEEDKQRRIAAIEAKKSPQSQNGVWETGSSKQLTIAEAEAISAKTQALQNERIAMASAADEANQMIVVEDRLTSATVSETQAISKQQSMLNAQLGSLEENIAAGIQYRLELKNIEAALKGGTGSTHLLTAQQIELKTAIAQNDAIIKQQAKDQISAAGTANQLNARLALLRAGYDSLTDAERKNKDIGGVWLRDIQELADQTRKISEDQRVYNKSVGDYENAIKSAISQYVPYGYQIIRGVDLLKSATAETEGAKVATAGLGTQFAAFTIGEFAVGIAAATYYLQQFRNTGQQVEQFMGGLKNQFANFGKNIVDAFSNAKSPDDFLRKAFSPKGFKDSFDTGVDVTKQLQGVKNLNEVNDVQIQKQQAQADLYRAQAKNVKLSSEERVQYLKLAQNTENAIINQQTDNAKQNIDAAISLSDKFKKLTNDQKIILRAGDVQRANELVQQGKITEAGYELLLEGYSRQTAAVNAANMKLVRQQNDEARIELKAAKALNNDQLELQKAKLQGQKDIAKLILDDEKNSYEVRLGALAVYVSRSKEIIKTQNEIANRAPGISSTKKKVNNQNASNENAQVDIFDQSEKLKIQKEAIKDFKKVFEDLQVDTILDLQDALDTQLLAIKTNETDKETVLLESYKKGKLNEQQYSRDLKLIRDQANIERIQAQKDTDEAILGIDEAFAVASSIVGFKIGNSTPQSIQKAKNKVTTDSNNLKDAKNAKNSDVGKNDDKNQKKDLKDIEDGINDIQQIQGDAQTLLNANYQQQIALLEQKKKLIADTASEEIAFINGSILSSKEKAREIAIINAQEKTAQDKITQQQNQVKEKQAKTDRALAIANIIENTAIGATKVIGQTGIFGLSLEPLVIALGAAQLATVLATPLPKFFTGTDNSPEGLAHVGEKGTELRIDPSGHMSLTPNTDTVTYLKKGTKIINNAELMRMVGKPEVIMYGNGQTTDNRKMEKLLEENNNLLRRQKQPIVNVKVGDRWGSYSQQRNY